jgi:hypothetical protein
MCRCFPEIINQNDSCFDFVIGILKSKTRRSIGEFSFEITVKKPQRDNAEAL